MGSKDVRWREKKKPKKEEKKALTINPVITSPDVPVVPKRKAAKEPE